MRILHEHTKLVLGVFCLLAVVVGETNAQVATSRIVGYNSTTCLGGSDTFLGVPFHRAPAYSGSVAANVTLNDSPVAVQASGTPGWAVDGFVGTHYVKFTTGAAAGLILEISANTAGGFTVNADGYGSRAVREGDRFLIIPHWTLETLLPHATQTTLHQSSGDLLPQRGSEIHFYEVTDTGIDLAPEKIYYVKSNGWFQSAPGSPSANNVVVPPHAAFIVRHQPGAANTTFRPAAHVDVYPSAVVLTRQKGKANDNILAMIRPIPITLDELGFSNTSFVPSVNTTEAGRRDEILIYDNSVAGYNKAEQARYFRHLNTWKLDNGADYPNSDNVQLPAGAVIVVRKASSTSDGSVSWTNDPNY